MRRGERSKYVLTPARAELAALHVGVAERAVRTYVHRKSIPMHRWPGVEWDDAIAHGYENLCKAAHDWNVDKGAFGSFAYMRCWFGMIDWLRVNGPTTRAGKDRPQMVGWVDEYTSDSSWGDGGMPTEHILGNEQLEQDHADLLVGRQFVSHCLSLLSEREAHIMRALMVEGRTEKSIGRELGISESRVSQLKTKALRNLRRDDDVLYALAN